MHVEIFELLTLTLNDMRQSLRSSLDSECPGLTPQGDALRYTIG